MYEVFVCKLFSGSTWNTDGAIVGIFDSEEKAKNAIEQMAQDAVEAHMYETYTYEPIELNTNLLRVRQVV